jgi:hypothetical protein
MWDGGKLDELMSTPAQSQPAIKLCNETLADLPGDITGPPL